MPSNIFEAVRDGNLVSEHCGAWVGVGMGVPILRMRASRGGREGPGTGS